MKQVSRALSVLLSSRDIRTVTVFTPDPKVRVRLTRTRKPRANDRTQDIRMSIGQPNYGERIYMSVCKRKGRKLGIISRGFPQRKK